MDRGASRTEGLRMLRKEAAVPTEGLTRRELTPVDTIASTLTHNEALVEYFKNIPRVRASVVEEAGSPALVVERKPTILVVGSSLCFCDSFRLFCRRSFQKTEK